MKPITNITTPRPAVFFFLLVVFLFSTIRTVFAQRSLSPDNARYVGIDVSFGRNMFESTSNLEQINRHAIALDGGQIGLTYGNNIYRLQLGLLGYYSSVSDISGTIDLYSNRVSANFYPLDLIIPGSSRVQPYITAGIAYDRFKFYGHYLNDDQSKVNYSTSQAPYLGTIRQAIANVGAGLNIKIVDDYNFVHLFTEVHYGRNISNSTTRTAFDQTTLSNQMMASIGLSFGARR